MGILSNLFKQKSAKPEGRALRNPFAPPTSRSTDGNEAVEGDEISGNDGVESAPSAPAQSSTEQSAKGALQGNISFGGSRKNMSPVGTASSAGTQRNITHTPAPEIKPPVRQMVPVKVTPVSDKEIHIELDEILPQIPEQFLKSPRHETKKTLTFSNYDLLPSLSHGKATVPLSRIAELAPEVFAKRPSGNETVNLPLQKVVRQIGIFQGRPDQVEEQYSPLDERYEKLILQKGVAYVAPKKEAPKPAPAKVEEAPAVKTEAVPVAKISEPVPVPAPQPEPPAAPVQKVEKEAPPVPAPAEKPVEAVAEPVPVVVEPTPEPEAPLQAEAAQEIETVSYSLSSLFSHVPKSWLNGDLKSVDDATRVTVPFHLIEPQLVSGKVELGFEDFFQALPDNFRKHFSANGKETPAAKIQIPLNEVFQNLPGVEPLPPAPKPAAVEPEAVKDEVVAQIAAPVAEPAPQIQEPEAKVEVVAPAAKEPEQTVPVVEEIKEVVPEEKAPEAVAPVVEEIQPPAPVAVDVAAPPQPEPAPIVAPVVEAEKMPDLVVPQNVPAPEPEPAPQPAAVMEPAPATIVEPVPVPEPEPPKVEAAAPVPPVIEPAPHLETPVYAEPPQPHELPGGFFTPPVLNLQHFAPPVFLPSETPVIPVDIHPETPEAPTAPAPVETKVVEAVEPVTVFDIASLKGAEGKLDLEKAVYHAISFDGVNAAVLIVKGKAKTAGKIPQHFNMRETGKKAAFLFSSLETMTEKPSPAIARNVTLQHEEFSTTYFKQGVILLGVVHSARALEGEQHDKLVRFAGELSDLWQSHH